VSNIGNTLGTTIVKFHPFPSIGVQFNAVTAGLQGQRICPSIAATSWQLTPRAQQHPGAERGRNALHVNYHPLFNNPWE